MIEQIDESQWDSHHKHFNIHKHKHRTMPYMNEIKRHRLSVPLLPSHWNPFTSPTHPRSSTSLYTDFFNEYFSWISVKMQGYFVNIIISHGFIRFFKGFHRNGKRLENRFPSGFIRSEEHTSELQSRFDLVCRLLLEKKQKT